MQVKTWEVLFECEYERVRDTSGRKSKVKVRWDVEGVIGGWCVNEHGE